MSTKNERKEGMTSKTHSTNDKKTKPDYEPPLEWTATEYSPRHRWWWFAAIAIVGLSLTAILFLADEWSAAALAFVSSMALVVVGLDRPREWHYRLDDQTLVVEGHTRTRPIRIEWKLADQAAVTREVVQRRNAEPYELLVLLGHRRLSWPHDVYLTGKKGTDKRILARITQAVPEGDDLKFQAISKNLQRLARLLHIA